VILVIGYDVTVLVLCCGWLCSLCVWAWIMYGVDMWLTGCIDSLQWCGLWYVLFIQWVFEMVWLCIKVVCSRHC